MLAEGARLRVYNSTRFGPPHIDMLRRVIGTTDINGKGTKHPVDLQADPFIFLDEGLLPPGKKPPFGAHPHTGLVANTIPLNRSFSSGLWDNINGSYGPLWADGMFQIKAGRGVVHDEGRDVPKELIEKRHGKEIVQNDLDAGIGAHLLQLWFNPGVGEAGGREREASETVLLDARDIPEVEIGPSAKARVIFGEYGGKRSPAKTWDAEMVVLDCTLAGRDASAQISLPDAFSTMFVYNTKRSGGPVLVRDLACSPESGEGVVNCQEIAIREGAPSVGGGLKNEVSIKLGASAATEAQARVFIAAGKPFGQRWVKLLGHDGALIGPSEKYVKEKMLEYEANKDNFGKQ